MPCHAHTPLTSYCSLFVEGRLVLTLGTTSTHPFSSLPFTLPFSPPLFPFSPPFRSLCRCKPVRRRTPTHLPCLGHHFPSLNQWTCLKPTTRTSSPPAFAVSRLGARAGARPSHNSAQSFHRRLAQLIKVKTSSASRDQAFPPRFGRPFFSPRDYGLARVVLRGLKRLCPRFAARPYRPMQSLSLHNRKRCQAMP